MNDFLTALVARTEGQLPVLERRARSLFEPAAGAELGRPLQSEPDRHETRDATPPPPRTTPGEARPESSEPGLDPVRPTEPAARRNGSLLPDTAPATARQRAPRLLDERHAIARAAAPAAAPDERAHARGAHGQMPLVEAPPARQRGAAEHGDVIGPRSIASVQPRAAPPTGTLQLQPASRAQPAVSLARAQAINTSRRESQPVASPTPAPVHISIGRVEIRAVQAPPEKPRATGPAAPRLSLDDYLKRRDHGAAR